MGVPAQGMEVELRDGSRALVRPIEPGDKWRLAEGLQRLSPRSRYLRFHMPVERLTETQLRYLTEVDHADHVALVALDPTAPAEPGMGVARYVRLDGQPEIAEAAVTVADAYQGRGVGTLLLGLLAREAVEHGVKLLRNYVLASNGAMLAVFDDLGATRSYDGDGVYVVDMPLPDDPAALAGTPAARVMRASACNAVPPLAPILTFPEDRGEAHGRSAVDD